jgi:hypothetical protein
LYGRRLSDLKKKKMEKLRNDLMELIQIGYEYDALMDLGNGWEPYEGCQQNLLMILEDPDTEVVVLGKEDQHYEAGKRRYIITLPPWWRKGSIALIFEESELESL